MALGNQQPITNQPRTGPLGGNAQQGQGPAGIQQQQFNPMDALMKMFEMAMGGQSEQFRGILDAVNRPEHSNIRSSIQGETRGQGLGNPKSTGLAGFYANNPNMRPGEFDPTGGRSLARGAQGFARQDQLGAMQHKNNMMDQRNQFAQGLLKLFNAQQGLKGKDGFGPAQDNSVFGPLNQQ